MKNNPTLNLPNDYSAWLSDLKQRISVSQQKAVIAVNQELISLYWQIGSDILERQELKGWGAKVIEQLSQDLRAAFPEMKGFSRTNLLYMRAFANSWAKDEIVQQAVGHLPWGHNLILLSKIETKEERLAYANLVLANGWSRNSLVHHIELGTAQRIGKSQSNFENFMPTPQSDLAKESLKNPYIFDFLSLSNDADEKDIKNTLITKITDFLLELGKSFAYVGKEVLFDIGGDEFYADLLFYHLKLHCYVVIEMKTGKFKPEYLGQLSFYMTATDKQLKTETDAPTIGLLLCKSKNQLVVEYALQDVNKPIGVSEYQIINALPNDIQRNLPTIEQIEEELEKEN